MIYPEMIIVIDLDGTICTQRSSGDYHLAEPIQPVIDKLHELAERGAYIIINTARGMRTCEGNIAEVQRRYADMTLKWLGDHGVDFNELRFGKPPGTMYVDDRGVSIEEFIK